MNHREYDPTDAAEALAVDAAIAASDRRFFASIPARKLWEMPAGHVASEGADAAINRARMERHFGRDEIFDL